MEPSPGGRITLRLSATAEHGVSYAGTASDAHAEWSLSARVAAEDGAVSIEAAPAALPEWLAEFARTTLRTAWRGSRAGTPWPRRVNRWRARPTDLDESGR